MCQEPSDKYRTLKPCNCLIESLYGFLLLTIPFILHTPSYWWFNTLLPRAHSLENFSSSWSDILMQSPIKKLVNSWFLNSAKSEMKISCLKRKLTWKFLQLVKLSKTLWKSHPFRHNWYQSVSMCLNYRREWKIIDSRQLVKVFEGNWNFHQDKLS